MPSTARTTPTPVRNSVYKSFTSSSGAKRFFLPDLYLPPLVAAAGSASTRSRDAVGRDPDVSIQPDPLKLRSQSVRCLSRGVISSCIQAIDAYLSAPLTH